MIASRRTLNALGAVLVLVALVPTGPAAAQSITSIRGLGYPILPADARTDALGGLGVGLKGLAAPLTNPAAAAGVARRGAIVSVAAVEQEASMGDASALRGATRFPLIQVLYPVRGIVITAGYGGYLDQSWAVERQGEETAAGQTITFRDFVRSTGGVGQLQIGAAVPIGSGLAVGAAVGTHTGSQRLQFQRLFDTTSVGTLDPFTEVRSVRYSAPLAQVGVRWDPMTTLRVGASVTWAGTLTADSASGPATTTEYDLPIQVATGVSANLAPNLMATFSGRWSGWSSVGEVTALGPGTAVVSRGQDTWELGGGLEWDNQSPRAVRSYPVRLGAQYRQLPFTFVTEAPTEWFVGAGAGMRIGSSAENPLMRVDLTIQRGERTAPGNELLAGLSESAWRFSLAFAVFGN